ncbi:putative metallo-beta-lactamase domain protein [Bisporella sp. PMI_857]|nr:putative metallo-beta-lactamase domain protein [Bisporella sp. PMI_857]
MATQLIPLQEVERLSSRVIRILGGNPGKFTLQGTNTYLVGTGPSRVLIDTGEGKPSWLSALKRVLAAENATVSTCILTHWHHDHILGVPQLLAHIPSATVYKHTPSEDQLAISDGQTFSAEGATLRAIHSPGHTQDHMSLLLEEEDAVFTGDNVLGHGTAVFEDLSTYISSLQKLHPVFRGRAYPGHGAVLEDGPSKILEYISHRKMREDQVVQVLRSSRKTGPEASSAELEEWTSMEIVKVVYANVPEELHLPANGGVVQILRKLEGEGKVVEDSKTKRWRVKDRAAL